MVYFYCDASTEIGFGHLQRCVLLARYLQDTVGQSIAFIETSATVKNHLQRLGIKKTILLNELPPQQMIIFDIVHEKTLSTPDECCMLLNQLHQLGHKIIFIDGVGEHRFNPKANTVPIVELILTPYLFSNEAPHLPCQRWLRGKEYILIEPQLKKINVNFSCSVKNVLITMGGSDKFNITLQVLNTLQPNTHLYFHIVLGSLFSHDLKSGIKTLAKQHPNFNLINEPSSLLPYYKQADLVICSTGITSYEVFAAGLPSIQISPTLIHAKNFSYSEISQCMKHLGYYKTIANSDIRKVFQWLLTNKDQRVNMANQARQLIDGNGLERVALMTQSRYF